MKSVASQYIDKYDIHDDENETNRLRALLKKLHDKKTIYAEFPFDYLPVSEQLEFLHYLLKEEPERQLIANFQKTDANRDYSRFIFQLTQAINDSDLNADPLYLDKLYSYSRSQIRDLNISKDELLCSLNDINACMLLQLSEIYKQQATPAVGSACTGFYLDYLDMVILQFLIYRVMPLPAIIFSDIVKDLNYVLKQIEIMQNGQLEKQHETWISSPCLTAHETSVIFANYADHCSVLCEEIAVEKILKEEIEKNPDCFGPVAQGCSASKTIISEEHLSEYQHLITEGQSVSDYADKIRKTQSVIMFMREYAHRDCNPFCLQDLKVYFREIYISKASYRRRQSQTIVKEYIQEISNKTEELTVSNEAHYIFFRSKLNRGYFREKGQIPQYLELVQFKKRLYDTSLQAYLLFDTESSMNLLYTMNRFLLSVYQKYFDF